MMNNITEKIALYALTEAGAEISAKLAESIDNSQQFLPEKLKGQLSNRSADIVFFPPKGFSRVLADNWSEFNGHVFVMATGIVVRQIASHLEHKTKDPAVVVCDEKGDYAISLLSGHIGGANRLAKIASSILGGDAVITTATDVQGIMAFDELAAINGWQILNPENIKILNSMLLEGKKIALLLPENLYKQNYLSCQNISYIESLDMIKNSNFDGAVLLDSPNNNLSCPFLSLLSVEDLKEFDE